MASGGGGGEIDQEYNSRLATIAEKLQLGSDEDRNIFKYGVAYNPNEKIMAYTSKNGDLVDGNGNILYTKKQLEDSGYSDRSAQSNDGMTRSAQGNFFQDVRDAATDPKTVGVGVATFDPATGAAIALTDGGDRLKTKVSPIPLHESVVPESQQVLTRGEIEGYDPNAQTSYMQMEQQQIADNMATMKYQKENTIANLETDRLSSLAAQRLIDPSTEFALEKIGSDRRLLPEQERAAMAQSGYTADKYTADRTLIPQETNVKKGYYNEVLNGVDEKKRMDEASGEVGNAFANAADMTARNLSRFGINPNSGRAKSEFSKTGLQYGSALAGARNLARDKAREEKFRRYSDAVGQIPRY